MRALITGATGFIGANLVRELLDEGVRVRALVRPASDLRNLSGLPVDLVTGDLATPAELEAHMAGCHVVFHVAARYSLWARDKRDIYRTNVEGTERLLVAAARVKVPRFVFTSSVAAIGVSRWGESADETTQASLDELVGDYKKSKYLSEKAVFGAAKRGLDAVIVNPSTPIGAYDRKPTPTGEIILRFLTGRMPAFVHTGLNLVDVRDVARGHILAWRKGRTGERYILGNRNVSLKEMMEMLASLTGKRAPRWALPHWIPLVAAFVDEGIMERFFHRRANLSLASVQMSRKPMFYSAEKAVTELGLPQSPIEGALSRAVEWFRETGMA